MSAGIGSDRRGGVAVEFALIAPVFLMIVLMLVQGAIALQRWNAMQTVGATVARCLAIASPRCTSSGGGGGGGGGGGADPAVAYAIQTAKAQGVGALTAEMIGIDTTTSASGVSYSRVSLDVPVTIFGASVTLRSISQVHRS